MARRRAGAAAHDPSRPRHVARTHHHGTDTSEWPPSQPDILFVDRDHGWATGAGGIMATTDGGRTWRVQRQNNAKVGPITFLDTRRGWAEEDGTIIATTDGGATWRARSKPHALDGASQLHFLDAQRGWAVWLRNCTPPGDCGVAGSLWRTTDGAPRGLPRA